MERAEEIYNKHFEEMVGANNLDEYSEADVNRVLNRLLKCLPNVRYSWGKKKTKANSEFV